MRISDWSSDVCSSDLIAMAENLTDWLRMNLYGGYAYDRYNEGGPILGGSLALVGQEHFEAGLRASHAKALTRGSSDDVTRAGAYAQWRFCARHRQPWNRKPPSRRHPPRNPPPGGGAAGGT